jgi:hypothetical protein
MDDSVTYNVPVGMVEAYSGRSLIVRARHPSELIGGISPERLGGLSYVQLLSVGAEVDDLVQWGVGVPIDVVMRRPLSEFMRLYRYAKLLENHPVRITVPVVAGFGRAVRMALALDFAVKLEMSEPPDADLIEELHEVLDLYLYRPAVSRPVEFFHTLFRAFYRWELATLWGIQEEDPARFRYVTDDGEEVAPRRVPRAGAAHVAGAVPGTADYRRQLMAEKGECAGCSFFAYCGGYFKWPARGYDCAGVKTLFVALGAAAAELRSDVEAFDATRAADAVNAAREGAHA